MEKNNKKIEPIDLTKVLDGYEDKWVVIDNDYSKILKSGDSLDEIKDFASQGIIMLVPNPNYAFTPSFCE